MAALTQGRLTERMVAPNSPATRNTYPQKGSTTCYQGGIVMVDASGFAKPGATATGSVGAGVAKSNGGQDRWTNSGADGASNVDVEEGTFKFANSAAGDAITKAEVGKVCYIVDDQTVAKTDGTGTRSKAGLVEYVDTDGAVFVRFDVSQTRQATV
jgi:hypothetical protein